jgi:hypothetical protein
MRTKRCKPSGGRAFFTLYHITLRNRVMAVVLSEKMKTAPRQIDGAEVVAFVILDPEIHMDSGSVRFYADGALQTSFYGLAIATYDLSAFYLFFSDGDWETENDTLHDSVAEAMETAERKFGVEPSQWDFYIEELKPA